MEWLLTETSITYKEIDSVIISKLLSFFVVSEETTSYSILTVIEILGRQNLGKRDYKVAIFLDF